MPMRAFRASKAYAGAHIKDNLWLWAGISAALAAVSYLLLRSDALGAAGRWGDLMALSGMVCGILVIMISHEGYVPTEAEGDSTLAA
jgi:hypothetical protein